jgi:hypothetical protein
VPEGGDEAFTLVGKGVSTGRAPADLAVARLADGSFLALVSLPDEGAVQVLDIDPKNGSGSERMKIAVGGRPDQIAVDATNTTAIVGNATESTVALLDLDSLTLQARLDVGGPSAAVAVGRLDPGDGVAPVALVLRRDAFEVAAIRLFRPGYREAPAAVLGRAALPALPVAAYVPDVLQGADDMAPTLCCQGLTAEGEATTSWAAVMGADGAVRYLRLDAPRDEDAGGARGLLRLVDNNPDPRGLAVDANEDPSAYVAPEGVGTRPVVLMEPADTFGDPPFVPLFDLSYRADYEAPLPGLDGVLGDYQNGEITPASGDFGSSTDLVQAGDSVLITLDASSTTCPPALETQVLEASAARIVVERLTGTDETCLNNDGNLPLTIVADLAFIVRDQDDTFRGRLRLDDRADPESDPPLAGALIFLDGFVLSIAAGQLEDGTLLPPPRGARLTLPVDPGVDVVGMQLSRDADQFSNGFGSSALFATSAAGGPAFLISTKEDVQSAWRRRLFIGTAAGLLLEMDQGETDINDVIGYR